METITTDVEAKFVTGETGQRERGRGERERERGGGGGEREGVYFICFHLNGMSYQSRIAECEQTSNQKKERKKERKTKDQRQRLLVSVWGCKKALEACPDYIVIVNEYNTTR